MAKTRLQIAKSDIVAYFDGLTGKVWRFREIASILSDKRSFWRLALSTNTTKFIEFLIDGSNLRKLVFPFPQRTEIVYTWGDLPLLEVLLKVKSNSYYSHYTAMQTHGLTEQVPKVVYITSERTTTTETRLLDQKQINDSFSRPHKESTNLIETGGRRVLLINGRRTKCIGVTTKEMRDGGSIVAGRVTGIERTLIDIVVRPNYSGGIFEVAKAFENAKGVVSINKLVAMLKRMSFAYPLHQAIGYYVERAGYEAHQVDLLRRLPLEHDFFLDHDMKDAVYVDRWRLFIPKGF